MPSPHYYRSKIGEGDSRDPARPQQSEEGDLVSVEDVLNTANLNDRMEMARLRHAQVLALRGKGKPGTNGPGQGLSLGAQKSPGRFSLGPPQAAPAAQDDTIATVAPAPVSLPVKAQTTKRRKGVFVAAAAIIAVLAGLAVSGPFRGYAVTATNEIMALFATDRTLVAPGRAPGRPVSTGTLTGTVPPQILVQVDPLVPGPGVDSLARTTLLSAPDPVVDNQKLRTPDLRSQLPETGPSALLGAAVPIFVPGSVPAADLAATDAAKSAAPELLPRLAGAPTAPEITAPASANAVRSPFENVFARRAVAPGLRVTAQEAQPDPRLGRLVPNYNLAGSPSPFAMDFVSRSLGLPGIPTSAEIAQNLPISSVALVATKPAATELVSPKVRTTGAVLRPRAPARILVSPQAVIAGNSPDNVSPVSVSLPNSTGAPLRQTVGPVLAARPNFSDNFITPDAPLPFSAGAAANRYQLTNLFLNAPASLNRESLDELVARLRASGFPSKEPNRVNFTISRTNVRYFHSGDEAAARALADIVGGRARDFTDFRPEPPQGTVEIWMAGESGARRAPRAGTPTGNSGADRALQSLRNRLLQSLRDGDN